MISALQSVSRDVSGLDFRGAGVQVGGNSLAIILLGENSYPPGPIEPTEIQAKDR
jgi:hypothetical protein